MTTRTLISVDLDWLNGSLSPICQLKELLRHIPKTTPAVMTVEHHEFIPQLRKWVKGGKVLTPFNILNIDEHHDYYIHRPPYHPEGTAIDCSNWGYRIPPTWYNRFTWVYNKVGHNFFYDWNLAKNWLTANNKQFSFRDKHDLEKLRTDIVAAVFCVSPDYLSPSILNKIDSMIEIISRHFSLDIAPKAINNESINTISGWRIAPRPLHTIN